MQDAPDSFIAIFERAFEITRSGKAPPMQCLRNPLAQEAYALNMLTGPLLMFKQQMASGQRAGGRPPIPFVDLVYGTHPLPLQSTAAEEDFHPHD